MGMNAHATTRAWSDCDTPIGRLTLTAGADGLDGLHFPGRAPVRAEPAHRSAHLEKAAEQLHDYFSGRRTRFELALDLSSGTPFQQAVWEQLLSIPYGETVSYSQIAARLGRSHRVRAVGAAVGRTPVPIIVPCHRVIGSDGSLTGYLGGLHRKQSLLDLEAAVSQGRPAPSGFAPRQLALL
jgi:methylated-DNA-[protein]-cysteine S-methyltransferase